MCVSGLGKIETGWSWARSETRLRMSLWLLNLYMDIIVMEEREKFALEETLEKTTVQMLLFANYLMFVVEDEYVERNLRMLDEVMKKWRMQINWKKRKVLTVKQGGSLFMAQIIWQ